MAQRAAYASLRPRIALLVATLGAASCGPARDAAPPWTAVALSVAAPRGGADVAARHCEARASAEAGCTAIAKGDRFDAAGRLEVARGARASVELDGAVLDVEGEATLELGESESGRWVAVHRGVVTLGRNADSTGRAAPALRVDGRSVEPDASLGGVVAVRVDGPGRGALTLHRGRASLRDADGSTRTLRTGDSVALDPTAGSATALGPEQDDEPAHTPTPRGLGTMTARVPGTTQVEGGVRLASHHVRVTVRDGFARTEVEEEFANDTARTLEGRYVFPLPPRASVSRLALWVGDSLVEGEIVERDRARRIFQGIVDDTVRPRDPALLEWSGGGELTLRVFPIPPHGRRKLVLAFDEILTSEGGRVRYSYPLSTGLDRAVAIDDFSVEAVASEAGATPADVATPGYAANLTTTPEGVTATFRAKAFVAERDFVLSFQRPPVAEAAVSAYVPSAAEAKAMPRARLDGRTVADAAPSEAPAAGWITVRVPVDVAADALVDARPARDHVVVLDVSASQSRDTLAGQVELVLALLGRLDPDDRFALLGCDSGCTSWPEDGQSPASSEAIEGARRWLAALAPRGSSDVGGALAAAARRLPPGGGGQVLYLGDGAASSGELSADTIASRLGAAFAGVDVRLFGAGRSVDAVLLENLARRLGGTYTPVTTGATLGRRATELALELRRPVLRGPKLELPTGIGDVTPAVLPNLTLGREIVVAGRLGDGAPVGQATLTGEIGGRRVEVSLPLRWGNGLRHNPLVPRLWAESRIAELEASGDKTAVSRVVELSRTHRVLSRHTSLLVLENDRMYAEFGIERTRRDPAREQPPDPAQGGATALDDAHPGSPTASWGVASSLARPDDGTRASEPSSASGNMWGTEVGDAAGAGGLGLSGVGAGGGGKGEGIGLGAVGTLGRGAGAGPGQGFGAGSGRLSGSHRVGPAATVRMGATSVSGALSPEIIRRIVRQSFGRLRRCYELGLSRDPSLSGRVVVRFVIASDGRVLGAQAAGGDLRDSAVTACVAAAIAALTFPQPEGGIVTVSYPFMFSPGADPPPTVRRPQIDVPTGPVAVHRVESATTTPAGEAGLDKLRKALSDAPESRSRHDALVRGLLARGRGADALAAAQRFVEVDPDSPRARELLAFAGAALGDRALALTEIDAMVELAPRSGEAHRRAARAFETVLDEGRACAHWRSLAELSPGADDALAAALRCRARSGERDAALTAARAVDKRGPRVAKLIEALEAGTAPAFEDVAVVGQLDVTVHCTARVEGCPVPVLVTPSGRVVSPWTPGTSRVGSTRVAMNGVSDGTYRTLLVGGAPEAQGDIEIVAFGTKKRIPFRPSERPAVTSVVSGTSW